MSSLSLSAARFIGAYLLLTALTYVAGERYSAMWCGAIHAVARLVPASVASERIEVETRDGQRLFRMHARTRDAIRTPDRGVPAGAGIDSTTPQANVHAHLVLVMALLAAWPVHRPIARALLLLGGVPAVVFATLLDLPFVLLGVAQDAVLAVADPQALASDWRVLWYQFLQRGGRPVLSLTLGGLVIACVSPRVDEETARTGV